MSINHPRRIFVVPPTLPLRAVVAVVLVGALVAVGAVLSAGPRQTGGNAPPPVAAGIDRLVAGPAQVAVIDGGTLMLRDRVVRLLGLDPPLRGSICRTAGGAQVDCAAAATRALAALVWETAVACEVHGQDEQGRPFAVWTANGIEVNRAQVAAGWARADDALPALKRVEDQARAGHRGLWAAR